LATGTTTKEDVLLRQWIERLRDPDPAWRLRAATVLGTLGVRAQQAVPALTGVLNDPSAEVRRMAISSLRDVCPDHRLILVHLVQAAQDADSLVRRRAIRLLGELGTEARAAIPVLIAILREADVLVRRTATAALGEIGAPAFQAIPHLIAALGETDNRNRAVTVVALGRMGPRVVPRLMEALTHPEARIRATVARILARHPRGRDALDTLQLLQLDDPEREVREAAAEAVEKLLRQEVDEETPCSR
jgi:HEAT repeat protein